MTMLALEERKDGGTIWVHQGMMKGHNLEEWVTVSKRALASMAQEL